ncbi:MAG: magnesium transporter CorA family protein [Thermoleophilia bacterium]|nr:magnesium transporter CorA family protein [Thermoleophilia bacterium]
MPAHLMDHAGTSDVRLDRETIERLAARADFFWLDVREPASDDVVLLGEVLGFHRLAVEDALHFGQRPKLDLYDDLAVLVLYGAAPDDDHLVEVHCFFSQRFLVTLRRDACPALRQSRERHAHNPGVLGEPAAVLHHVVDVLVDSFFPLLSEFDDFIDAVEEGIFERASEEHVRRVFLMKRKLVTLRKAIGPQRDLLAGIASGVSALPGVAGEVERSFRDAYDHLIRLTDMIDSYRDLLTGVTDLYLSTVSNRLNGVMKQLAAIATVFLPLTFITGFFGQNFRWLTDHAGGLAAFLGLGLGTQVVTLLVLVGFFRRRGWL